jgi:hypothetical protein
MNYVELNLQDLCGIICWNARWDDDLNLRIDFGQPSLSIREPKEIITEHEKISQSSKYRHVTLRGEWFFWVLSGYWKLSLKDSNEVTNASSYQNKKMALIHLSGQKLFHSTVNPYTSATQLDFDLGARLTIRRMSKNSDKDIWYLYKPNGYVLSVRADGKYHDDPRNIPPEKFEWKPIFIV